MSNQKRPKLLCFRKGLEQNLISTEENYPKYMFQISGGSGIKNLPAKPGDETLILGSGRPPRQGNGNPLQDSVHGDSPGKHTGVGSHALLQGIFPTQGSNPGLLHCRQSLYCLSYQESLSFGWNAISYSKGSS